jgi:hypothetical protein
MHKLISAVAFSLVTLAAWAEGPGTRIRTTPEVGQPTELIRPPTPARQATLCDSLRADARERCLRQSRETEADRRTSGPHATGMGSGAGSAATSGASDAAIGASAPR